MKLIIDPASSKPQLFSLPPTPLSPHSPHSNTSPPPRTLLQHARPHSVRNEHRTDLSAGTVLSTAVISGICASRHMPHTWSVPVRVSPRHLMFFLLSRHVLHDKQQLAAHIVKRASSSSVRQPTGCRSVRLRARWTLLKICVRTNMALHIACRA